MSSDTDFEECCRREDGFYDLNSSLGDLARDDLIDTFLQEEITDYVDYQDNNSGLTEAEEENWIEDHLERAADDFPAYDLSVYEVKMRELGGLVGKILNGDRFSFNGRVLVLAPGIFKKEVLEEQIELSGRLIIENDGRRILLKQEVQTQYPGIFLAQSKFYLGISRDEGISIETKSLGGFGGENEQDIPYIKFPIAGGWPHPCEARIYLREND